MQCSQPPLDASLAIHFKRPNEKHLEIDNMEVN